MKNLSRSRGLRALALNCSAGLFLALPVSGQDLLPGSVLDAEQSEHIRASVAVTGTSIEGAESPELGKAVSDSISAGLLRRSYRVFHSGAKSDVRIESSLVGSDGYYHLMLKRIDPETEEVIGIHESHQRGGMEVVFPMVARVLQAMHEGDPIPEAEQALAVSSAEPSVGVFPSGAPPLLFEHSQRRFADAVQAEIERRQREQQEVARRAALKALAQATPAIPRPPAARPDLPRRRFSATLVRQQIGTVLAVNDSWKFCIVEPRPGIDIEIADILETLYAEESRQPYAKLIVTRQAAGDAYVASYGTRKPNRRLFPGEPVYAWVAQRTETR